MKQQHLPASPERELAIALDALERVQVAIRRADTKAAGLVGCQLSVLTIALGATGPAGQIWAAGQASRAAAIVLAVLGVGGLACSLAVLGAAIWPRLSGEHVGNLFAFPALAALAEPPRAPVLRAPDDAWLLAMALSRTARRKYELVRLAMVAMAVSTTSIVGWLCLVGCSQ
jgi:hypothetical protein